MTQQFYIYLLIQLQTATLYASAGMEIRPFGQLAGVVFSYARSDVAFSFAHRCSPNGRPFPFPPMTYMGTAACSILRNIELLDTMI